MKRTVTVSYDLTYDVESDAELEELAAQVTEALGPVVEAVADGGEVVLMRNGDIVIKKGKRS